MNRKQHLLSQDEAAMAVALDLAVVRLCFESGLITPAHGYDEADLRELRRVRRLIDDLGLDPSAIDVVVHMRRRLLALQAQVQRLEAELRRAQRMPSPTLWVDAEWSDIP